MRCKMAKPAKSKFIPILIVVAIAVIVVIVVVNTASQSDLKSEQPGAAAGTQEAPKIAYKVVWEHAIPNGGYTRSIYIDPGLRNEPDLTALGRQLASDTQADRNAFIFVFDDEKAAQMASKLDSLSDAELAYWDEHQIGFYARNINTGHHELSIMLAGPQGKMIKVDL